MSKWGFPVGTSGKEPSSQCRRHKRCEFDPWLGKIPWRRQGMATHSRILARRIPWTEELGGLWAQGCKESDMTEVTYARGKLFGCKHNLSHLIQQTSTVPLLRRNAVLGAEKRPFMLLFLLPGAPPATGAPFEASCCKGETIFHLRKSPKPSPPVLPPGG